MPGTELIGYNVLLLNTAVLKAFVAVIGLLSWLTHRDEFDGIGRCALGILALAVAETLFLLGPHVGELVSTVVGNSVFMLSIPIIHHGLVRFYGERARSRIVAGYAVVVVLAPLIFVWTFVAPNQQARVVAVSLAFSVNLALIVVMLGGTRARGTVAAVARIGILGVIGLSLLRVVLALLGPPTAHPFGAGSGFVPIVLAGNITVVGFTVTMILLVSERLRDRERRVSERYRTLLREVHHRVKNSVATAVSLLRLSGEAAGDDDSQTVLKDAEQRLSAFAVLHELLCEAGGAEAPPLGEYLSRIAELATEGEQRFRLELDLAGGHIDAHQMVPCGLIVNELIANAAKHAFPDGRKGTVRVSLRFGTDDSVEIAVEDDGVGFCSTRAAGMGLSLIDGLVRQLEGTVERQGEGGTSTRVSFPAIAPAG